MERTPAGKLRQPVFRELREYKEQWNAKTQNDRTEICLVLPFWVEIITTLGYN